MEFENTKIKEHWEEWMFEYINGAFYIFPTDDVIHPIDKLRQRFDKKSADICQAHISLSEPLTKPLTEELLTEISKTVEKFVPFEITYGPLKTFPPHPGVCYDVFPKDIFFALRKALHNCSVFEDSNFGRVEIAPHITIAEFDLTWDESEEMRKKLDGNVPVGKFKCEAIEYSVPNDDFYFERRFKIPLGKTGRRKDEKLFHF